MERKSSNSGEFSASWLPLLISTVIVVLTIVAGFWSLADPRSELKAIRESFLTVREHEEFVSRFNRDVNRIELENRQQDERFQTIVNSRLTKEAADLAFTRFEQRLNDLVEEFRELRRNVVDQKQLDGRLVGQDNRMIAIQRQLEGLIAVLHQQQPRPNNTGGK